MQDMTTENRSTAMAGDIIGAVMVVLMFILSIAAPPAPAPPCQWLMQCLQHTSTD